MRLVDRLRRDAEPAANEDESCEETKSDVDERHVPALIQESTRQLETEYQELKSRVHIRLFELLDLSRLSQLSEERVRQDIVLATERILDEENEIQTGAARARILKEIQDEVFGLGPLEPLLQDPTVSDILVNGHAKVYVERHGKLENTIVRFKDDTHLMRLVEKIVAGVGRRVDEMTPMVDARLADGSRVNVIIPPLALDGPMMSIRRFAVIPLKAEDLVAMGTLTAPIVELLEGVAKCRLNVLISGGTGAGKTTLLNVLSAFIPEEERIVTIEDSAELQLNQEHVVRLETRPANVEGKGRITQRDLVINSLRMRPDRIVLGEVRGGEAFDMLQAMNTGHDGSLTTVHANSPRDALGRIENMVAMAGLDITPRAIRQQIASAIDVVIQLSRLSDGTRCLTSLQEVTGMEGEVVTMQEIFTLDRRGVDSDGRVISSIVATGIRPRFMDRLPLYGVHLSPNLFETQFPE